MSKSISLLKTSLCFSFISSPCKSCRVRKSTTFSFLERAFVMAFESATNEAESIKLYPLKLAGFSTVFCHSIFTSAFADTTTTNFAFISTAQLIAVKDLPNLITAYINRFDLCLFSTASLKLLTAVA